ncbi:head morphogenesis protein [Hafnia phage Pocis76]|uniref:Head morphogenesis protein n=1 Tax=Hafnia phage Pocis76 TaxID=2831174 RepID=A0A8E7FN14_9CAUD|nr:head morphogenesis protein [Hafnia phage Pocis76]
MNRGKIWRFPEATERQLRRSMQKAIRELIVFMRSKTRSMKFDASEQEITDAEAEILNYSKELALILIGLLPTIARTVYKFNSNEFVKIAKATGGRDNQAVLLLIAFGAKQSEQWYNDSYKEWEALTIQSFDKLFTNIINDWSSNIRQANFTKKTTNQVNEIAEKRFIVYSSWASNRASGIVGSWNSRLMRQRLEDAKVESYFWHGMLDEREREKHVRWEGKEIFLNEIHVFPSEEYGCRCWAVPNWKRSKQ